MIDFVLAMTVTDWIRAGAVMLTITGIVIFILLLCGVFDDHRIDL